MASYFFPKIMRIKLGLALHQTAFLFFDSIQEALACCALTVVCSVPLKRPTTCLEMTVRGTLLYSTARKTPSISPMLSLRRAVDKPTIQHHIFVLTIRSQYNIPTPICIDIIRSISVEFKRYVKIARRTS